MKQRYGSASRDNDERKSLLDVANCDHYEDDNNSYSNNIEEGFSSRNKTSSSSSSSSSGRRSSCWRSKPTASFYHSSSLQQPVQHSPYLQTKITKLSSQLYSLDSNVNQISADLSTQHHQLSYVNQTLANLRSYRPL